MRDLRSGPHLHVVGVCAIVSLASCSENATIPDEPQPDPSVVLQVPPALAEYGDAPDNAPACEFNQVIDPARYPTQFGSANAAPGRTGPFHFPMRNPRRDYFLGATAFGATIPTVEPVPFQPVCDWLTPPCDDDEGPLVLCLDGACNVGVLVTPGGPCRSVTTATFGVNPTNIGFWVVAATRGAQSTRRGFVNVVVDWDLDGRYGNDPTEWVLQDRPLIATPGQTQLIVTRPFPVLTVIDPCQNTPGRWCVLSFWSRFHLSNEAMLQTFDGITSIWDGSGKMSGYEGGETVDLVPFTDPPSGHGIPFDDCNNNQLPDVVDIFRERSRDQNRNLTPDECDGATTGPTTPALVRRTR